MDALHLGVILPNYGEALHPEALAAAALAAEESGLDSGWVTDHLLVPAAHAPVYGSVAEALVSLGFLAGRTRRLRLGVSALVVPQREPLLTLKQLLSLDLLSGGRVLAAVTAGWLEVGRRPARCRLPGPALHAGSYWFSAHARKKRSPASLETPRTRRSSHGDQG